MSPYQLPSDQGAMAAKVISILPRIPDLENIHVQFRLMSRTTLYFGVRKYPFTWDVVHGL